MSGVTGVHEGVWEGITEKKGKIRENNIKEGILKRAKRYILDLAKGTGDLGRSSFGGERDENLFYSWKRANERSGSGIRKVKKLDHEVKEKSWVVTRGWFKVKGKLCIIFVHFCFCFNYEVSIMHIYWKEVNREAKLIRSMTEKVEADESIAIDRKDREG